MSEMLRWLGRNAEEVICAAMMTFMTILGFANDGVWVALGNGAGGFSAPRKVVSDLGYVPLDQASASP